MQAVSLSDGRKILKIGLGSGECYVSLEKINNEVIRGSVQRTCNAHTYKFATKPPLSQRSDIL